MMTAEKPHGRKMFEALIECGQGDASALAVHMLTINDSGVYLNRLDRYARQTLVEGELAILEAHPTGRYDDPVLPFRFGIVELLKFENTYMLIAERRCCSEGERRTDGLTGDALWLLNALLDVVEGNRTENEVNDEERLKFLPTHTQAQAQAVTVEAAGSPPGAGVVVPVKRECAFDSALQYLQTTYRSGKFKTTEEYIRELRKQSGKPDSLFKESTAIENAFFLKNGGKSISHSLIADRMKLIR